MANLIHGTKLDDVLNGTSGGITEFVTLEHFDPTEPDVSDIMIELY